MSAPASTLEELEFQMQFTNGVVVRLAQNYGEYTTKDLFVVTSTNAKTVSVSRLGGNGGKYLRVPFRGLVIVPIDYDRATVELVAA